MSLYSLLDKIPAYFFVSLINSTFVSLYVDEFVNNTQTFQINDARQLPIIIPNENTMMKFKRLFDLALKIKKSRQNNELSQKDSESNLNEIQGELDILVNALYRLI